MTDFDPAVYLPDDLLERVRSRAAAVDAENRFPDEDLAELTDAGYLAILAPRELGGAGLGLAEAALLQQRL
ncbi:MAG TPA: acyl-CoA dehydrogenase family protein, partial [Microbacterium sp.]|nr:acyl-CoA dehydrogenase family protein [Microbacterium sp.]